MAACRVAAHGAFMHTERPKELILTGCPHLRVAAPTVYMLAVSVSRMRRPESGGACHAHPSHWGGLPQIDSASGSLLPFYDDDTGLFFVGGKVK